MSNHPSTAVHSLSVIGLSAQVQSGCLLDRERQVCVLQLLFHPLSPATVKAINQNQRKGQTPDPTLIQNPKVRELVEKFNLMEEMFGKKAAGQVEANKQVSNQASQKHP